MSESRARLVWSLGAMLLLIVGLELTARAVPVPDPIALLAVGVALIAWRAGSAAALAAALLAILAVAAAPAAGSVLLSSGPGWPRLLVAVLVLPLLALVVGTLRGRSRRRLAQEVAARDVALATERRFRQLVDNIDAVIWEGDPETYTVSFVGSAAERAFGYPAADWLAGSEIWRRLIHPADYERVLSLCREAARRGQDHELEYRVITAAGETRWVRDLVRVESDATGRPLRLFGVLVDATARKRAEAALRESEDRLRRLIDQAADALLVHELDGRLIEVNRRACEMLGHPRDELLSMRMADIEAAHSAPAAGEDGETRTGLYRRRDGTTFPVEVRADRTLWDGREVTVAIARDVSERTRLEQQLRMSQKMDAVGLLAGGIAQDFNNLLTAIKGHIELLLVETKPGDAVRADLEEIAKAADRAAGLTRQLLAFSRRQIFTPAMLDAAALIRELGGVFHRLAGDAVAVTIEPESLGLVHADRGQIEQVLLNLVSNAREAMPDGGSLRIATRDEDIATDAPLLRRHPYIVPGEYVVISVTDTGHGMDAHTLGRIFEPFFTTRTRDQAAGLGLSTAYGIVKQSDGYLIATSRPGRGATLEVYLPRRPAAPAGPAPSPSAGPALAAHRTILVVEDEAAVRSLIGRVLTKKGYTVIQAADGREALRLAESARHPIDLLISDIVMPGMDGPELARRLAAGRPGLRTLLISGYSHDAVVRDGAFPSGTSFLGKPFTPTQLATRVEEILAG